MKLRSRNPKFERISFREELDRAAQLPAADRADCHGDRGLGGIDDRDPQRLFQRPAVARHAGAAHHQGFRAILVPQPAADLDHAGQSVVAARRSINAIWRK